MAAIIGMTALVKKTTSFLSMSYLVSLWVMVPNSPVTNPQRAEYSVW